MIAPKRLVENNNSLFSGFPSRLALRASVFAMAERVILSFPVREERTEDDSRANSLTSAVVTVDSTHVTSDLSGIRIKIKAGPSRARRKAQRVVAPLALTSMVLPVGADRRPPHAGGRTQSWGAQPDAKRNHDGADHQGREGTGWKTQVSRVLIKPKVDASGLSRAHYLAR
jgi:hypothetical protein